ncbi:septal ring lytic transglycosylase RlpA family protein [Geovibrio thiophilus]|uniref:Probable endolytic peptidoglycan transglycosylase RlpA n=1 Tax=Geovibrio thiophilus TaxID=139438 RepID=A0A3R5XYE5_9BACT|nr:septal ring lytic transglycosylase RlpA family protein [Geovibrio thiophilus]QAR34284.1 septal ring lytic transglycosylase RlpA family protein [Geovibrio thiophilus]
MGLRKSLGVFLILTCVSCATVQPEPPSASLNMPDDDIKPFVDSPVLPEAQKKTPEPVEEPPALRFPDTVFAAPAEEPGTPSADESVEKDHRIPPDTKMTGAVYDKPYVVRGETYHRLKYVETFEQEGIASWYGGPDHGRDTSNGETYNMYAMTAAHKNLPMGSMVEVENLSDGRKVTVRVNDRGPHVEGRIIDLSKKAANEIGIKDKGLGKVKIRLLAPAGEKSADDFAPDAPNMAYAGTVKALFAVQIASFTDKEQADALANTFGNGKVERASVRGTTYFRVKIGGFESREAAEAQKSKMTSRYPKAFVVTE